MARRVNIPFGKGPLQSPLLISVSETSERLTQGPDLLPPGEPLVYADLAEQALEGLVRAPHYARLDVAHVGVPVADVLAEDGRVAGQILHGEIFDILFRRAGRTYGRARRDGVVGWLSDSVLKAGTPRAAYRVCVLDAALPFNALVQGDEGVEAGHLAEIGLFERDLAGVAEGFAGVAYQDGARGSLAVDGIGLVQQALFACGQAAPRRACDLAAIGYQVSADDLQRGDVVVWTHADHAMAGHAAIMIDGQHLVHASPLAGKVIAEQLADVAGGLSAEGYDAPVMVRLRP